MHIKLNTISANFRPNSSPIVGTWYGPYKGDEALELLTKVKGDILKGWLQVTYSEKEDINFAELDAIVNGKASKKKEVKKVVEPEPVKEPEPEPEPEPVKEPEPEVIEEEPEPEPVEEPKKVEDNMVDWNVETFKSKVLAGDISSEEAYIYESDNKKRKSLLTWLEQLA